MRTPEAWLEHFTREDAGYDKGNALANIREVQNEAHHEGFMEGMKIAKAMVEEARKHEFRDLTPEAAAVVAEASRECAFCRGVARFKCVECGKGICAVCAHHVGVSDYCPNHAYDALAEKGEQ